MARRSLIASLVVACALVFAGAVAAADFWPKHEPNAADQALAKRSVLHLTQVTPGWKSVPAPRNWSSGDDTCGSSDRGRVITGSAATAFEGPMSSVSTSAEVMETLAMAREDSKQASDPRLVRCSLPGSAPRVARRRG